MGLNLSWKNTGIGALLMTARSTGTTAAVTATALLGPGDCMVTALCKEGREGAGGLIPQAVLAGDR